MSTLIIRNRISTILLLCLGLLMSLTSGGWAQQSDNHLLHAAPVPGKMVIDGKLDEWDLSGQIEVFANYRLRNSYSAKVAAMYDRENFYLAVSWRDPTPMYNMIDSNYDIGSGWKSDCLQLRLKTDMVIGDVTCWYSTAAKHPVINITYGRFTSGRDVNTDVNAFVGITDALKVGAREAFLIGDDGKSYTQEIALPWKLITGQAAIVKATGKPYLPPKSYQAGDRFNMGMEFLWGPADGRTFPIHRYADLLKEGQSVREFFWTAEDAWGPVVLEPKGHLRLPAPDYGNTAQFLQKTAGPVKLSYTMPYDGFATLVIDNDKGQRVKNLIGMAPRGKGKQVDYWDGADDFGKLLPPGVYHWHGLLHQGLDPTYEASYGTAGTPAWDIADGTGAWMSDHNPPCIVAAGTDMLFLAAQGSEAGWALLGVDLNGKRLWGERKFQGNADLAVDETYLYGAMNQWWDKETPMTVGRLVAKTGKYAPFATKPTPLLIVPVTTPGEQGTITGLDVTTDRLAVAISGLNVIRFFNKSTMDKLGQIAVPGVGQVAYGADGTLFAIAGTQVVKVTDAGLLPVISTHLEKPFGLAIDKKSGAFYVTDRGSQQIIVFAKDGAFLRAIGTPGGRPQPGTWDPNGLLNPAGLDIDAHGRLWVAEENMWPKRVSVWTADGQLVKDFLGPTTYGGMGAMVDAEDKTRVFGNGCEYRLDYAKNQTTVIANVLPNNLVGDLCKYQGREYFLERLGGLYLRKGDAFIPVARFGRTQVRSMANVGLPLTAPAGATEWFSYLWCDLNDDGIAEPNEVTTTLIPLESGGWGGYWLDEQFSLYSGTNGYGAQSVSKIPLKGWTAGGAPLWDLAQWRHITDDHLSGPNYLYLAEHGKVIVGSPMTCFTDDGTQLWSYGKDQCTGVHGSHYAPITERDDQLFGALACIGKADSPMGTVFAVSTNIGRLFLMTTDGLLVGSIFQDARSGSDAWPSTEKPGAPLGGVTMGGEWFGGYFFKAKATNEYYLVAGGTSYNLIKLNGLDKLQPITGGSVKFTGRDLLAADALQKAQATANPGVNTLAISRIGTPATIDANLGKYPPDRFVTWAAGPYRAKAAVATDGKSLYLAYEVSGKANPLVNGGQDSLQLFTSGDSVDLQLGVDPTANPKRTDPVVGDLRLLISVMNGKPIAVLYRWKTIGDKHPVTFTSPWRTCRLDEARVLSEAQIAITRWGDGFRLEAAVPLTTLGFTPEAGKEYRLDLGTIFADASGTNRAARVYWANKATGLVNDVPGEIMASPNLWGTAKLANQ